MLVRVGVVHSWRIRDPETTSRVYVGYWSYCLRTASSSPACPESYSETLQL